MSSELQRGVGLALRRRREGAGLTQEALAARSGVHATYISNVERGNRNLSLLVLERLAEGLAIRASELLRDAEDLAARDTR